MLLLYFAIRFTQVYSFSICDDCGQEVLVKLMGKHKRTHFNFKCTPCNRHFVSKVN